MKACFMGLGYIGLPTAIIATKYGIKITGVDINPKVVEMTNQGKLHIIEPGMEEMLQEVVNNGNLHASTTPEESDAILSWFLPHLKAIMSQTSHSWNQQLRWLFLS